MAVEINGLPPSLLKNTGDNSAAEVARSQPSATQGQNGRPGTADTVSLTDAAARLQRLEKVVAGLPVVDSQRVEALRKAVQDGSYQVDADRLAARMLDNDQELNASHKK